MAERITIIWSTSGTKQVYVMHIFEFFLPLILSMTYHHTFILTKHLFQKRVYTKLYNILDGICKNKYGFAYFGKFP